VAGQQPAQAAVPTSGLKADHDYIDRWSLRLDLGKALRTLPAVLRNRVAP
jgi:lipopolysaccharide/colanic/teichoic acid biosynthesis glycosyltransferase